MAQRAATPPGDLTARIPDDDDGAEVGQLGSAIDAVLDRIQQLFGARLLDARGPQIAATPRMSSPPR